MSLALTLIGGEVLGPYGLRRGRVSIEGGRISEAPAGREVDLSGYLVLPGIVDIHGDGFERHLAPRRGAMKDLDEGLVAAEAELAANGITTAVLAQFLSWEGGLRGPEFADRVFTALRDVRGTLPTDLRGQARVEMHLTEIFDALPDDLERWGVDYVIFNDHLPHDALAAGKKPPRLTGQALKAGRNPDRHWQMLVQLHAAAPQVPAALDALCVRLALQGVRIGSHDDATAAVRETWRRRGAAISEFPETAEAAEAARAGGDAVILGAPNVVRGGSHKGNASAVDLIAMGLCDALASDYHYPSPRRAALMLVQTGLAGWADAWALVSAGPARILGLEDRGRIAPGLRADLCILDAETHRVAATLAGGRISYMSGDIAARLTS
jgi:alpha-D-ribose 1-methylphosphonate 5-triphosphate diphosphatase